MQCGFVCKNCGEFISYEEYKKQKQKENVFKELGCLIWGIILLCFVSLFLIPIAILLLILVNKNTPTNECPYCAAKDCLIPADTPIAQKILNDNYDEEDIIQIEEIIEEEKTKEQNKIPLPIIIGIIITFIIIVASTSEPNKYSKTIEYQGYKMEEIYHYPEFSLYVYYIPKNNFNLKKFVNYAQTVPRNSKTGTNFFFVFNETFDVKSLNSISKQVPLYILDDLWKRKPYFYFSSILGYTENFCKIDGTSQDLYIRNLTKGEKYFNHIMSYDYKYLDAQNGCTPEGHDI